MWTATDFETRHRLGLTLLVYGLAFACWPLDPHDVLGFIIARSSHAPFVDRALFCLAAIPTLIAALLQSWQLGRAKSPAPSHHRGLPLSSPELVPILVAASFGLLLNRLGCVLLVGGISILHIRARARQATQPPDFNIAHRESARVAAPTWLLALALLSLAVTLREWPFYLLVAAAVVVRFIQTRHHQGA